jgi:integrase
MAVFEKRTTSKGNVTYRAKVRIKGRPAQSKTFARLSDARRWAQKIESEIHHGKYLSRYEADKHTVSELIDRYLLEIFPKKSPGMQEIEEAHLRWWKKEIGVYYLSDINTALLIQCRFKLENGKVQGGKKRSPTTCNRYIATLRYLFTIAERDWEWIEFNPVKKVVKLKEPPGVVRFLDDDERERLLNESKKSKCDYLYLVVLLAMTTGMRLGEIMTLTWRQVQFIQKCIILEKTKNGRPRRVPLQGIAFDELRNFSRIRRLDTDLLFPRKSDPQKPASVYTGWLLTLERACVTNFRFHDLRHTAASYFAMTGATARDLCDIFGWQTMQMAMRYAHLSESHTGELAARMSEKFMIGR